MKRHYPITLAVVGAILAAGAWATHALVSQRRAQIEQTDLRQFSADADRVQQSVQRRFDTLLPALQGVRGLIAGSEHVSGREFEDFVATGGFSQLDSGVKGLAFVANWSRARLDSLVAAERREQADFQWRPLGDDRPGQAYPVRLAHPNALRERLLGQDLATERLRRQAAEQAAAGREAELSTALLDSHGEREWWALLPVFTRSADRARRPPELVGWALAPLSAAALLGDGGDTQLQVALHEVGEQSAAPLTAGWHHAERLVMLGGRLFRLDVRSPSMLGEAAAQAELRSLTWSGGVLTLALAALACGLTLLRLRVLAGAADRHRELAQLSILARHTTNAVLVTDRERRIRWVNEAFTRLYGHSAEHAIGRRPEELLYTEQSDPQALRRLQDAWQRSQPCRVELVNRCRDGRLVNVDTELMTIPDAAGQVSGFIEIGLDQTAQRETARQLAAVIRENQGLINTIREHTIVSVTDAEGRIIDVNDAFCRISGYSREELLGQNHRLIRSDTHPRAFWREMWAMMRAGRPWRGQVCNRAKDGSLYWVDSIIAPFFGADGRIERLISIRSDVTAAKRHELAVQESERFLDQVAHVAGIGGWSLSLTPQALNLSERLHQLLGIPADGRNAVRTVLRSLAPWARYALINALRRSRGSGEGWDLELPLRRPGAVRWLRVVGEPQAGEHGRPERWLGSVQDITRQRELKDNLRRSHETMAGLIEHLPLGLALFDGEMRLQTHNQAFAQAVLADGQWLSEPGRRLDEIVLHAALQDGLPSEEGLARVRQALGRMSERRHESFELARRNGRSYEATSAPMPDGGMVLIYADISERKSREAQVRRAEALLRTAINTLDEGFVLYGPDDRLVLCNEPYRRMFSTSADLITDGASFEDIIRGGVARGQYPEAHGREEEWIAQRLATHRAGRNEIVIRLDNGHCLRVIERRMPDGHTVGFRIDITELVEARERAEAASQVKGEFLANMSHEVRTPLNAVLGMLRLLRRTPLSARQADYVDKSEGAARALLALLNDILDASKIEAGKMVLDPQPFATAQLFSDLSLLLHAQLRDEHAVQLLLDIDPGVPAWLHGDAMRLMQVLLNLGGNALKFTERGQVRVGVLLQAQAGDTARLRFEVSDTGIGISSAQQERIFNSFGQAETSTTRRYGGTGLGLAISSQLVQMMGGELLLESVVGEGSRFHFTLSLPTAAPQGADDPAWQALTQASLPGPAAGGLVAQRLRGMRLLLVEDNANNRQVARELLQDEGALVDSAEDGQVALERAGRNDYDAILMDVRMPVMDGLEATRQLRALPAHAHRPIIAMSANVSAQDRAEALAAGMDDHVGKPFDLDALVRCLQRWTGWFDDSTDDTPALPASETLPAGTLGRAQAAGIDLVRAWERVMGRTEVLARMLNQFANNAPSLAARLEQLSAQDDQAGLEHEVHALKGLSAMLGHTPLSELAASAEALARAALLDRPRLVQLRTELLRGAATLGSLARELQATRTAGPRDWPPADPAAVRRLCRRLAQVLAEHDMAATDLHAELHRLAPGLPAELAGPLDGAMARLDFAAADQALAALDSALAQAELGVSPQDAPAASPPMETPS